MSLNGKIGKQLITLHGTLDTLLPIATDSDFYAQLIRDRGRSSLHRYYVVEYGNHVDGLYDVYPDRLRPILPCFGSALTALDVWSTLDHTPPAGHMLERPSSGDLANTCSLGN